MFDQELFETGQFPVIASGPTLATDGMEERLQLRRPRIIDDRRRRSEFEQHTVVEEADLIGREAELIGDGVRHPAS